MVHPFKIKDNLIYTNKIIVKIKEFKWFFYLYIDWKNFTFLQNYIIFKSYISNKNIIIMKIYLIIKELTELNEKEIDVTFLSNFTYIEFKLWAINIDKYFQKKQPTTTLDPIIFYKKKEGFFFKINYLSKDEYVITKNIQPKKINEAFFLEEIFKDIKSDVGLKYWLK